MAEQQPKDAPKSLKPYPFDCEMSQGTVKIGLKVIHLALSGLVAHVQTGICHVGMHYQVTFTVPESQHVVVVEAQVYKTHDAIDPKTGKAERVTEILFVKLTDDHKQKIRNFVNSLGQRE